MQLARIISILIECKAQKLYLHDNNRFQIISQIQYAQYDNLKLLSLKYNEINNIQPLSFMQFSCLQDLYLRNNKISQIKCMSKLSTPSLDYILINSNPLIQIHCLTRSKINSKKLISLYLQYHHDQDPTNQDLSVVVKLISNQFEHLYIRSEKRINQDKIKNMLKLRFPSLKIKN